jgi:hypothetical protein
MSGTRQQCGARIRLVLTLLLVFPTLLSAAEIIVDKIILLGTSGTPLVSFKAAERLTIKIEYRADAQTGVGNTPAYVVAVRSPGDLTLWSVSQQVPVAPNVTRSWTLNQQFPVPDVKDDITFRARIAESSGQEKVATWRRGKDGVYRQPTQPPLPVGSTKTRDVK